MYGLGAFALRTIEKDQYIGGTIFLSRICFSFAAHGNRAEYVGELFSANRGDVLLECVPYCLQFVRVFSFSRPYPVLLADIAI